MIDSRQLKGRADAASPTKHARLARRGAIAAAIALVVTATSLTASPANGQPGVDPAAVEQTLRAAGVVTTVAPQARVAIPDPAPADRGVADPGVVDKAMKSAPSTAVISLAGGLAVKSGKSTVQVRPVAAASAKGLSPAGLAVYADTAESSFALSKATTGGNAAYAVITGAGAPTSYQFAFTVDGKPAALRLTEGGGVDVLDGAGNVANAIVPAWAKDATGAAVPTSYSVSGNILTQSVSHAGAAYPVVADPRLRCDGLWCTLELTRNETRLMAASALSPGIACRFLGPGAGACAALLIAGWAQANIALATGQCVGFRVWRANFVSYMHLAYVGCYA